MPFEKNSYVYLIDELDKSLNALRILLMTARDSVEKNKIKNAIDAALDERLQMMKARDAVFEISKKF